MRCYIPVDNVGLCRHCQRVILAGQVALEQRMPNNPILDRKMMFHADCISDLLSDAPTHGTDPKIDEFHALRERIAVTGLAFPD